MGVGRWVDKIAMEQAVVFKLAVGCLSPRDVVREKIALNPTPHFLHQIEVYRCSFSCLALSCEYCFMLLKRLKNAFVTTV